MKRFSFVIPTYQKSKLLIKTLDALNNQVGYNSEDYEVIVVDDGSNENTYDLIKGINKNYELRYMYLERNKDSCRSKTRNEGWKEACGEIVIFIDDDIIINEYYLYELDRVFSLSRDVIVIGTRLNIPENLNKIPYDMEQIRKKGAEIRYTPFNYLSFNPMAHRFPWLLVFSCNMALPKELLETSGGFDEDFKDWGHEDIEIGYRLYKKGVKIVLNHKLEVLHQPHPIAAEGKDNLKIFLQKCPGAFEDLPHTRGFAIYALGYYSNIDMYRANRGRKRIRRLFEIRDSTEINEIKEKITSLVKREDIEIVVNDYMEDSDMDLWIQLLEIEKSIPLYFPMSKFWKRNMDFYAIDQLLTGRTNSLTLE